MKIKTKMIFSGALAATLISLSAAAATSGEMPATATNSPAASVAAPPATGTNLNNTMTALFGDPDVAKGKNVEVKQSELDEVTAAIKAAAAARGQAVPEDQLTQYEAMALNEFIDTKLLLQKATAADRAQGQKEADSAIAELIKQSGSKDALVMRLKGAGKTFDQFHAKLAESSTANAALVRELGVTVSDADIKAFYTNHPSDFDKPEQVHVRHILLMTIAPGTQEPLTDAQKEEKHKLAEEILKKARAGGDFAALAKQYSEDPDSKDNGGDLPPFSHGEMLPEFDAAAFSLTNNQISDIVTTRYGYHIIKFIGKTPEQTVPLTEVSDNIKMYLLRQKLAPIAPAYLEKLRAAADVQILDPNLKAAVVELQSSRTNMPEPSPEK